MTCVRQLITSAAVLSMISCGSSTPVAPTTSVGVYTTTDLVVGTGTTAAAGSRATVTYGLWLYDTSKTDGKGTQVDAGSFTFAVGTGSVITGFDRGVTGMKVGGSRRLIVPPDLAYGSSPPSAAIPVNATLVFDVALTAVS